MGFVSFIILVWDHIITLEQEVRLVSINWAYVSRPDPLPQVEYIWKGKKGIRGFLVTELR